MIKTYSHYCFIILAVAATATATTTITTSVSFWSNGLFFPEIKDFFWYRWSRVFFIGQMPFLLFNQQCQSTSGVERINSTLKTVYSN